MPGFSEAKMTKRRSQRPVLVRSAETSGQSGPYAGVLALQRTAGNRGGQPVLGLGKWCAFIQQRHTPAPMRLQWFGRYVGGMRGVQQKEALGSADQAQGERVGRQLRAGSRPDRRSGDGKAGAFRR
jgi:hypothetical protein